MGQRNKACLFIFSLYVMASVAFSAQTSKMPVRNEPVYEMEISQNFFNSKLQIQISNGNSGDSVMVTIGRSPILIASNGGRQSCAPPGREFEIDASHKIHSGKYRIRLTDDSLIIQPLKERGIKLISQSCLLIPVSLKNHLYWVTAYGGVPDSYKEMENDLTTRLEALGASRVTLKPGDYGIFKVKDDSGQFIQNGMSGWQRVTFFSYADAEDKIQKLLTDAVQNAVPKQRFYCLYSGPDETLYVGIKQYWYEIDAPSRSKDQGYDVILRDDYFTGNISLGVATRMKYKEKPYQLSCTIRETHEGMMLRAGVKCLIAPMEYLDTARALGSYKLLTPPADHFNLDIIGYEDTARLHITNTADSFGVSVLRAGNNVITSEAHKRIPPDVFWVYLNFGNAWGAQSQAQFCQRIKEKLTTLGAVPFLLDNGTYLIAPDGISIGEHFITRGDVNATTETHDGNVQFVQLMFFHYAGSRDKISKEINDLIRQMKGNPIKIDLEFAPQKANIWHCSN
jgi:hypothetical protein